MLSWTTILFLTTLLVLAGLAAAYLALIVFTPTTLPRSTAETFYYSAKNPEKPLPLSSLSESPTFGLSIIVPAYNERERLGIMVDEAMTYLSDAVFEPELNRGSGLDPSWYEDGVELVVVDDGSRDDTARIAIDLASRWEKKLQARRAATDEKRNWPEVDMRVIKLERNRGKGGAVRHGVLFARGRRILFADADGASRFSDLTSLQLAMDALLEPSASSVKGSNGHARRRSMDGVFGKQSLKGDLVGHAMVAGSRAHLEKSQAVVQRSFVRNLLMHGFHVFVRTMGVSGIRDTQCGFKLFTRETARVLFPTMHLHRWSFDVELLLLASLVGIPVAEVPIDWHEVAGSKISVGWDGIGMARDLLVLRGNLLAGRWKVPRVVKASPLSKDQE